MGAVTKVQFRLCHKMTFCNGKSIRQQKYFLCGEINAKWLHEQCKWERMWMSLVLANGWKEYRVWRGEKKEGMAGNRKGRKRMMHRIELNTFLNVILYRSLLWGNASEHSPEFFFKHFMEIYVRTENWTNHLSIFHNLKMQSVKSGISWISWISNCSLLFYDVRRLFVSFSIS